MSLEAPKIPTANVAPRIEAPKFEAPKMEASKTAAEAGSDFKEDPFQNYRYEDPFLISDPFQDDEVVVEPPEVPKPAAAFKGKFGNF